MKKNKWYIFLTLSLLLASMAVYSLQLLIFKKPGDTFFYLFQDLAFVPISVLLVTLVIDNLLKKREKQALVNKMNMVVGIFFSEMGNDLLKLLTGMDSRAMEIKVLIEKESNWTDACIKGIGKKLANYEARPEPTKETLVVLKDYLLDNRNCLMRMLENPNLLEHESFTDTLWAVSHLTEELAVRKDLGALSKDDTAHLANDINRAYGRMLHEWISYIKHLKVDYPYIFKLATKHHPFVED